MPQASSAERIRVPTRVILLLVGAILIAAAAFYFNRAPQTESVSHSATATERPRPTAAAYVGSQSCRDCHAQAFDAWQKSHHALAERTVDAAHDHLFFKPSREIKHGTQVSRAKSSDGKFDLITRGEDG